MKSIKSDNKIRVLVKRPGEIPKSLVIKNELSEFQGLVGGNIEVLRLQEDILCIVNEEGKLRGDCKVNFWLNDDIIMGTAVFVGSDEKNGDFKSLSRKNIEKIMLKFGGM